MAWLFSVSPLLKLQSRQLALRVPSRFRRQDKHRSSSLTKTASLSTNVTFQLGQVDVFRKQVSTYTLLRSTINLFCPFIFSWRTVFGPYEEKVIPRLLDSFPIYEVDKTLLLDRCKTELMQPHVAARTRCHLHLGYRADPRVEQQTLTRNDS